MADETASVGFGAMIRGPVATTTVFALGEVGTEQLDIPGYVTWIHRKAITTPLWAPGRTGVE